MAKEIRICKYSIKDYLKSLYDVTAKQLEILESLIQVYDDSMLKAEAPQKDICLNLVKGLRGLAKHIGCSPATAQHIVNSGELQKKALHTEPVASGGSIAICLMIFFVRSLNY